MSIARQIYALVARIPRGKVTTYGEIARCLKTSPRAVGRILHRNPHPLITPCHRVVFADGSLSHSFAFGGLKQQKDILQSEKVQVSPNQKVDLSKYFYCLQ